MPNYPKTCFVVMPFGKKSVGDTTVDFDAVYENVFVPAVGAATFPGGQPGELEIRRTDKDFFAGNISTEMFHYLEYSRIVLADISGLNPNVFYELGHRHRARAAGTIIVRQTGAPIPFDIKTIKAFPYDYEPDDHVVESRALIARVLSESLIESRPDSPIRDALAVQQRHGNLDALLKQAEDAIRNFDPATAILRYQDALAIDGTNPLVRVRLGLLHKDDGDWLAALEAFNAAINEAGDYADAWREKAIAENKIYHAAKDKTDLPDGEPAFRKALLLNPGDFDASASLGGLLKRRGDFQGALDAYAESTRISRGHPYPLLNEIVLMAQVSGTLDLRGREAQLKKAERARRAQATNSPPYDPPWSAFDMALLRLLQGDSKEFGDFVTLGIGQSTERWQPETFLKTLRLLPATLMEAPDLAGPLAGLAAASRH